MFTDINEFAKFLGDCCYGFLALNFLWGLYCVVLIWRRLKQLRFRSAKAQTEFLTDLQAKLDAGEYDQALEECEYNPKALPQLSAVIIANRQLSFTQLRQLVAEIMQRDILADVEHRIGWIATVIKSGPLLGLFGTVLGMMAAFGRIGTGEKVQPSMIAAEISIALVCTAMGLTTAIPFNYILASMQIRLKSLQESLESGLTRVLENFRPEKV